MMAVVYCKLEGLRKVYLTFIMLAMKNDNIEELERTVDEACLSVMSDEREELGVGVDGYL